MSRRLTVLYRVGADQRTVVLQPGDSVASERSVVCCRICRLAGDGDDLRSPSGEGVCILRVGGLFRIGVRRCLTVLYRGGVYLRTVVLQPGDRVASELRSVRGRVCRLTGDGDDLRCPARECVCVFCVSGLFRIRVRRRLTVLYRGGADLRTVVLQPGDRVAPERSVVRGRIGRVACDGDDLGSPSRKGVFVLRVLSFDRGLAGIRRRFAVSVIAALQFGPVVILEGDLVFDDLLAVRCFVCRVAGDRNDLRRPSREDIGLAAAFGLDRSLSGIDGKLTGFYGDAVQIRPVFVFKTDGIGVGSPPLRVEDRVLADEEFSLVVVRYAAAVRSRVPAVERIPVARELILRQIDRAAVFRRYGIHRALALVGMEVDQGQADVFVRVLHREIEL